MGSTLFVSDLDHTLLRRDASLSDYTIDVINGLVSDGVSFTYATARSHQSAHRATSGLNLALPVITYGGTMTAHPATGIPYTVRSLPAQAVPQILQATAAHAALQPLVYTYRDGQDSIGWRVDAVTPGIDHFLQSRNGDPRLAPVTDWAEIDHDTAYYVSIIGSRADIEPLRAQLGRALPGCMLISSEDTYAPGIHWLEIHSEQGSKAAATIALARQIGATRVVAFGDNHNDIPLFEVADESYAVANAVPELRRIATGVIGDNDSDAVAAWLHDRFRAAEVVLS